VGAENGDKSNIVTPVFSAYTLADSDDRLLFVSNFRPSLFISYAVYGPFRRKIRQGVYFRALMDSILLIAPAYLWMDNTLISVRDNILILWRLYSNDG
jgi:hypothetical protein